MSEFVQLVATEAVVKPATKEEVYDKYWMTSLRIRANNPMQPVRLVAELVPARDNLETMEKELMPNATAKTVVVKDVFALAANNASFAKVMNDVLDQVRIIGSEQGIMKEI